MKVETEDVDMASDHEDTKGSAHDNHLPSNPTPPPSSLQIPIKTEPSPSSSAPKPYRNGAESHGESNAELDFLIAKYLVANPRYHKTGQALIQELEANEVIPRSTNWEGRAVAQDFHSFNSKISHHIGPEYLSQLLSTLLSLAQNTVGPGGRKDGPGPQSLASSLLSISTSSLVHNNGRTRSILGRTIPRAPTHPLRHRTATHSPLNIAHSLHVRDLFATNLSARPMCPTFLMSGRFALAKRSLGHLSSVYCVLFDQSGKFLVTAADDKLVKIWSLIDGRLILTLRGNSSEITDLAINLENTLLASSTCDRMVRVWSLSTGELLKSLTGHTGNVTSVFFCPMSRAWTGTGAPIRYLATTGKDGSVCFWAYREIPGKKVVFESKPTEFQERMRPGSCQMLCAGFSSGGIFFAAGNADCNVRVYYMLDPEGPKRILENQTHTDRVDSISWAHQGVRFVSGSRDGLALVWRLDSKAGGWRYTKIDVKYPEESLQAHSHSTHRIRLSYRVTMVGWSCDDSFVFTAIAAGSNQAHRGNPAAAVSVKVWCPVTGNLLRTLFSHTDDVYVLEPHPQNPRILATAGHDGKIILWDVGAQPVMSPDVTDDEPGHAEPPPGQGHKIIYEYKNLLAEETGQGHGAIFDAKWSPDGHALGATDSHGNLLIFTNYGGLSRPKVLSGSGPGVPDQLFFHTDYRPLTTDAVTGEILDEQTQVLPHLMPPPFLVNSDGAPYPSQFQRLVPGRELCRDEQLIPNVAVGADGGLLQVLDQRIAELAARAGGGGQISPPLNIPPVPDPGVRHTHGNWQRTEETAEETPAVKTTRKKLEFVPPLKPPVLQAADALRLEFGEIEESTFQAVNFSSSGRGHGHGHTVSVQQDNHAGTQNPPAFHSRRLRQLAAAAAEQRRIQEERRRNEEQGVPLPNPPQMEISSPQFRGRAGQNVVTLSQVNGRGGQPIRRRLRYQINRNQPEEPEEEMDDERDPSFSESGGSSGSGSSSEEESDGDSVWGTAALPPPPAARTTNEQRDRRVRGQTASAPASSTARRRRRQEVTSPERSPPARVNRTARRPRPRPNVIHSDHEEDEEAEVPNASEPEAEEPEEPTPSASSASQSESDWSDQHSHPRTAESAAGRKKKRKSLRSRAERPKSTASDEPPTLERAVEGAEGSDEDYQDPRALAGPSSRLTRSKANPDSAKKKSRPKRSQPRKNLDEDLLMDGGALRLPSEWLASTQPKRFPYYPQLGDELVYFRQGHENYVNKIKNSNLYPTDKKFMKQLPYKAHPNLPAQVPCRVTQISFINKPPVVVQLKLAATDWESREVQYSATYTVTYHDVPEVVDFLILRQYYDKSMRHRWNIGDRFRCLIDNVWWLGNIIEVRPEASQFLRYKIQWEDERTEDLSPWDLDVVPDNFVQSHPDTSEGVPARPEEIRDGLYEVAQTDWPPYGHIDIECDRILGQLSVVMELGAAEPFLVPVDLNQYPEYLETVTCPVDLSTIKTRLENRFYRRTDALKFDIKLLNSNTETFNQPRSEIVKKSRILKDLLLRIVEGQVEDPTREFHAMQERYELGGSGAENQAEDSEESLQKTTSTNNTNVPRGSGSGSGRRLLKELNGAGSSGSAAALVPGSRSTRAQMKKLGPGVRLGGRNRDNSPAQGPSTSRSSGYGNSNTDDSVRPWNERCLDLLLRLHSHADSAPFRAPVDPTEYPDYHVQIDTPMDLQTIREEFLVGAYETPLQFSKDMGLVFSNSRQYNTDKHSQIYKMTLRLKNMFEHQFAPILADWRKRKNRRSHAHTHTPAKRRIHQNQNHSPPSRRLDGGSSSSRRRPVRKSTRTSGQTSSQQSTPRKNPLRHAAARNPYVNHNEDEEEEEVSEAEVRSRGSEESEAEENFPDSEDSEEEEDSEPVADGDDYRDHRRKKRRGRRSGSTNTPTPPARGSRTRTAATNSPGNRAPVRRRSSGTPENTRRNSRSARAPGSSSSTRSPGHTPQQTTYSAYGRPVKRLRIESESEEEEEDEENTDENEEEEEEEERVRRPGARSTRTTGAGSRKRKRR